MTGTSQLTSSNLLSGVNGQGSPVRTAQSDKIKYSGSLSSLALFSSLPRSAILEIETKLVSRDTQRDQFPIIRVKKREDSSCYSRGE